MPHEPKPPVCPHFAHQLQLVDRSPVQTPAASAANSPAQPLPTTPNPHPTSPLTTLNAAENTTDPSATPRAAPDLRSHVVRALANYPTVTIPELALGAAEQEDIERVGLTAPMSEAPDFKGAAADWVSHLDRSPSQTGFHTRAPSPEGKERVVLKCHDAAQAGDTVRELRLRMMGLKKMQDEGSQGEDEEGDGSAGSEEDWGDGKN